MAHIIYKINFDIRQTINGDLFNLQIGIDINMPIWLILRAHRPDFSEVAAWYNTILAEAKKIHGGGEIDADECIGILQRIPLPPKILRYF